MSGEFWLDWVGLVISLFNTIVLVWLGLTVLLNAERRNWGIWLAGGGLLIASGFFLSHSAILGLGLDTFSGNPNFWWHAGWVPIVLSPLAWYVAMLWYAGFWDEERSRLRRRHFSGLVLSIGMCMIVFGLLVFANPLPSFNRVLALDLVMTPSIGRIPLLVLLFPLYLLACIGLSVDALLRPGPVDRMMGDLARRRARPWLLGASSALLLVSLLVGWVMVWVVLNAGHSLLDPEISLRLAGFDLLIDLFIALAVILIGQAVVSYEIFTGKTLPRRGLQNYYHRALFLAAGYGAALSWALLLPLRPVYSLLLNVLLITAFYALLNRSAYLERERFISLLRPFVANQQLYDHLLAAESASPQAEIQAPFCALVENLLGAQAAYLVPLGPLSLLFGPPLACPPGDQPPAFSLSQEMSRLGSPQTLFLPLEPGRYRKAAWAVPLWRSQGLMGVLLLAEKRDGGLYTQEEVEIAREVGERLMDTQASAALAHRLMALQRQRLAESQVLDRRARRILHDDVLPRLHAAMLELSEVKPGSQDNVRKVLDLLTGIHHQAADLLRDIPASSSPEIARLGLVGALRQLIEDELLYDFDHVDWYIDPKAGQESADLPPLRAEVLYHAAREVIRNAARHGRPPDSPTPFHLNIELTWREGLEIVIEDNGTGMNDSAANGERQGHGLALHSTMMAVIGGDLSLESVPGTCTRVSLKLPRGSW